MRMIRALAVTVVVGLSPCGVAGTHLSCTDCGPPGCAAPVAVCNACEYAAGACGSMACGTGICGCSSACMPACSVCGDGTSCWDCCYAEAIDVDSLTPEAQSKKLYDAGMARLIFVMPEDGTVYLLNQMMTTLGEERTYEFPVPDATKLYAYEIRVEFVRGGKKYFKKTSLSDVRAGSIIALMVVAPPVPDGDPAVIVVESEVVAAGGVGSDPVAPVPDGTDDSTVTRPPYEG